MEHDAPATINSRNTAQERFRELTGQMPEHLQMGWHNARMAMGLTKATSLLEDTLRHAGTVQNELEAIERGG